MNSPIDSLRSNYEHIYLVQKLLASAQIELMRRQFTHDRSKLVPPEQQMFEEVTQNLSELTYGSEAYEQQRQEMMGNALGHHYAHNRHHPEYFLEGIEGMNLFDVIEMFLDWMAATQRHTDGDINRSIEINKGRFGMSEQLVRIFQNTIPWVADEFANLNTQRDLSDRLGSQEPEQTELISD